MWNYVTFIYISAPLAPLNLQSSNITDSSAELSWTPGYDGGKPQTYVIQYKLTNANSWENVTFAGSPPYNLEHLKNCESYLVQIFAYNVIGLSSSTPAINFMTDGNACFYVNKNIQIVFCIPLKEIIL